MRKRGNVNIELFREDVSGILKDKRYLSLNCVGISDFIRQHASKERLAMVDAINTIEANKGYGPNHIRVEKVSSGKVVFSTMVEYESLTEKDENGNSVVYVNCAGDFNTNEEAEKCGEGFQVPEGYTNGSYHVYEHDPDEYYILKDDKHDNCFKNDIKFWSETDAYVVLLEIIGIPEWYSYKKSVGKTAEQRLLKAIFGEAESVKEGTKDE